MPTNKFNTQLADNATLKVIISIDVEEEGLFSGKYERTNCSVNNIALLPKLAPITKELGFPLTLFCTHSVFSNPKAREILAFMHKELGAEIGAHLHHWSTPPYDNAENIPPIRTDKVPKELLRARLKNLLECGQSITNTPLTSFRMGRWDLKKSVRPILAEEGILVDSSVAPLRFFKDGADHFMAPSDPFWVEGTEKCPLLEVPITQISLTKFLPAIWYKIGKKLPANYQAQFIDSYRYFSTLSANPLWHNYMLRCLTAKLHSNRGGRVLSLFWHSSEMMPGASPHVPNQEAADKLLKDIFYYLRWLKNEFNTQGQTLSSLYNDPIAETFLKYPASEGDW